MTVPAPMDREPGGRRLWPLPDRAEGVRFTDIVDPRHGARSEVLATELMSLVADKWSSLVLIVLRERTLRFTEIRVLMGEISHRMLATTLRRLEREGFVVRTAYATMPPRVDYELTALGHSVLQQVDAFCGWSHEHEGDIRAARDAFDRRAAAQSDGAQA